MSEMPFSGVRVLELGSRLAAGACGRLLADLGAEVVVVEPRQWPATRTGKWHDRAGAVAGKQSLLADAAQPADAAAVARLVAGCHVLITSTDADGPLPAAWAAALGPQAIACDITAFGATGPLAGTWASEAELQACSGVVETTGLPGGAATPVGVPVLEMSAALYAASAIGVALQVLRRDGIGQAIDVALFDVGVNALTTFMPAHCAGLPPRRLGNGHGMAVPWNGYPAADGWILVCSTNDSQWRRIAGLIDPALAAEPRFAELRSRLVHREEIDARITRWTQGLPLADVARGLGEQGIPCGSIVTVDELESEPNLQWRQAVRRAADPVGGTTVRVAGALIRLDGQTPAAVAIPAPDSARAIRWEPAPSIGATTADPASPFAGLRVVEIGQLTTAPLAARHLASFGADVIKIEPAEGESARAWAPLRDGVSHFFVVSNGEKRSMAVDLRDPQQVQRVLDLVDGADVLVENMKPGALARLGLGAQQLLARNPRLVYCAISGFGVHSVYEGRPAVDTVVQAMSGMMDATRSGGVPLKTGISAADITGGVTGLLAIAAALARRDKTGRGGVIDISMQDVGAWMTQSLWNHPAAGGGRDGESAAAHVATVADVCSHPQTAARELIVQRRDPDGTCWDVFGSPMRFSRTPARIGTLIGRPSSAPLRWNTP